MGNSVEVFVLTGCISWAGKRMILEKERSEEISSEKGNHNVQYNLSKMYV